MNNKLYKNIIDNLPYGYSCHKTVENRTGSFDFEYVDINKAFEEYTGLSYNQVMGKTISSIEPFIFEQSFNWTDSFNKAKAGDAIDEELYSAANNQYYKIVISSEDEYIITHIMPQKKVQCHFTEQQCFVHMNIVPIMMLDDSGRIYRTNKIWSQEFEIVDLDKSKFFVEYVHPEDRQNAEEKLMSVKEEFFIEIECRLSCGSEKYKETELRAVKRGKYIYVMSRDTTKEKDLERKLKSSVENFESFFMAIDDLSFVSDYNGNILYTNKAVQNKLGYTLQETMKMNILDFHPEELRQEAINIVEDMLHNKRTVCPLPVAKKDGTPIPMETRIWFGQWNNKDCFYSLSKDLSNEQESLQRLLKIFNEIPAYVTIKDLHTMKIIDVNNSFIRKFGYTEKEVIGKTSLELGIYSQKKDYYKIVEDLKNKGFISKRLLKYKTKSGNNLIGMISGTVIESQGKKYLMKFMIDMTKQTEFENKLIQKGEMQQLLVKLSSKYINMPLENIDHDINNSLEEIGKYIGADRAYIFRYDLKNGTTSNTFEWCKEGISPHIDNLKDIPIDSISDWFAAHSKGELILIHDVYKLDDNVSEVKKILVEQNVKSLISIPMMENNECIGFVGFDSVASHRKYTQDENELLFIYAQILVNISMRKKQETLLHESRLKAQKASEIKSNFIARISHEIRTPLNGALGFMELLAESATMTRQINYINKAKNSINILLKLVDDLRDISRIEANMVEIKSEPVSILSVIDDAVTPFIFDINKKGIVVNINVDADIPVNLLGDADRLKQIIINLVNNSIRHTENGSICISCSMEGEMKDYVQLKFCVKDSGKGISKQALPHVFEPFFQEDNSYRSINGMGLGLAICKELVSKMDGHIWVESEQEKGTSFYFTVTLGLSSAQFNSMDYSWDNKYKELRGIRVLLAEDNAINKELTTEILNSRGIDVDVANNGAEAIEAIKSNEYDVILMDIQMPVMDGLEATMNIRRGEILPNIPIIAMTASVMQEDLDLFFSKGINGIVEKPLNINTLLREIYLWTKSNNSNKESISFADDDIALDYSEEPLNEKQSRKTKHTKNTLPFIEELSQCLKENNVDALELIKTAKQKKAFSNHSIQISRLESYINKFDFQGALDELSRLVENLD